MTQKITEKFYPAGFLRQLSKELGHEITLGIPKERTDGYHRYEVPITEIKNGIIIYEMMGLVLRNIKYNGPHPIPDKKICLECFKTPEGMRRRDTWTNINFPGISGLSVIPYQPSE